MWTLTALTYFMWVTFDCHWISTQAYLEILAILVHHLKMRRRCWYKKPARKLCGICEWMYVLINWYNSKWFVWNWPPKVLQNDSALIFYSHKSMKNIRKIKDKLYNFKCLALLQFTDWIEVNIINYSLSKGYKIQHRKIIARHSSASPKKTGGRRVPDTNIVWSCGRRCSTVMWHLRETQSYHVPS